MGCLFLQALPWRRKGYGGLIAPHVFFILSWWLFLSAVPLLDMDRHDLDVIYWSDVMIVLIVFAGILVIIVALSSFPFKKTPLFGDGPAVSTSVICWN